MLFLASWWKAILGAALASVVAYGLHGISERHAQVKLEAALQAQETVLAAKCEADKAITTEVSHDYQNSLSLLDTRAADALRLYGGSACLSITSGSAAGYDAAPAAGKPSRQGIAGDTVRAETLIKYLKEGEHYRLQLLACQSFVSKVENEAQPH